MARPETAEQILARYLAAEATGDAGIIRELDMEVHWSVALPDHYNSRVGVLREHLAGRGISPQDLLRRYYPESAICRVCGRPSYPYATVCRECHG